MATGNENNGAGGKPVVAAKAKEAEKPAETNDSKPVESTEEKKEDKDDKKKKK